MLLGHVLLLLLVHDVFPAAMLHRGAWRRRQATRPRLRYVLTPAAQTGSAAQVKPLAAGQLGERGATHRPPTVAEHGERGWL